MPRRRATRRWAVLAVLLASGARALDAPATTAQLVRFDQYPGYSSYGELARRLLSPLDAASFMQRLEASRATAASQPLDLAHQEFLVRLPARKPENGYALLVFVPPWRDAKLPGDWQPVLDQAGVAFVTAADSGNDADALGRRAPLALMAAYNFMQRYPVDPRRVYVAGFSGGARVALRLALGYPDLFHGALLNAGSDVVGNAAALPPIPLPPRELLYRFQESSRLVYATGGRDEEHLADDRASIRSLGEWCIYDWQRFELPRRDHAVADAAGLARALAALDAPAVPDPQRLGRCRDALQAEIDARLGKVAALLAGGQESAAQHLLVQIDRRFGGLAAPRSLEFHARER